LRVRGRGFPFDFPLSDYIILAEHFRLDPGYFF